MKAVLPFVLFRQQLAQDLKEMLPNVKSVLEYKGQFTTKSITQIAMISPSLHCALLGIRPATQVASGGMSCVIKAAVFIATKDEPEQTRDEGALNLAAAVMIALDRWYPVIKATMRGEPATNFSWVNLFAPEDQPTGVMLSAVQFDCTVTLDKTMGEGVLLTLKRLTVNHPAEDSSEQFLPEPV